MKKEFIKIGIAILVLFGIAIPLSLHREKQIAQSVADDLNKKFISVDLNVVDRIQVVNKNGDVVLQRRTKDKTGKFDDEFNARDFEYKDPPEWLVTKPSRAIADPSLMEGFFTQIKGITYDKVIQDTKDRKKDYSLDPADLSFRFFLKDQSEPKLILDMGSQNPANTGFYFAANDKPGIYLGERVLQPYIDQDIDRWYEKRVLGIPDDNQLEDIKIQHADKMNESFEMKKDKDRWFLGPVSENLLADTAQIKAYAAGVDSTHASLILTDDTVIKKNKPVGSVTLKFKAFKDPVTYYLFSDPKDPRMAYVQRSDIKDIFCIGMNPHLIPNFSDMVKRTLMDKSLTQISAVKIIRPSREIDLANVNQVWKIQKPFEDDANPRRLDAVFKAISELKPEKYLPNKVMNEKNRSLRIEYTLLDNTVEAVSFFEENNQYFVQAEGSTKTRIFSLPQNPTEIYEHLSHLRNDDLVPVAKQNISRLVFTKGKSKVEIEQNEKKGMWVVKFLENVPPSINAKWKKNFLAEDLLNTAAEISILNFHDHVDPNEKYDTATLEFFSDQNTQYTWKFGEKRKDSIEIYSPERKISAAIDLERFEELAAFLEEPTIPDKKKK